MADTCIVPKSSSRQTRQAAAARLRVGLALLGLGLLAACNGSSGTTGNVTPGTTTKAQLQRIEFGRLVDVYGLDITSAGSEIALYRRDVVIGGDIQDERGSTSNIADNEITYDFIAADPDTLQPRLFIPRDMKGEAFKAAFDRLDDNLREVAPMAFGQGGATLPYGVVPRNAAIRLTFSAPLGVDDSFFVERNGGGAVTGLRNTEAVQLLKIVGDPTQVGSFEPLPARVVVNDRQLILDPVLLGTEGLQYQTVNNASGLPASPDQIGANIRIALALEGPLAIPSVSAGTQATLTGLNNSGRKSVIRDFRSGNANDNSSDFARGFVRDPLPLRIVGEIPMYLERVEEINAFTQEITVYKAGVSHEIDRGDIIRFVNDSSGIPFGSSEVVVDPEDDRDSPATQHVRVRVRFVKNLASIDPRNLPGYPASITDREPWLVAHAPRAVCVAEYTAGDGTRDDPRNFLNFTPAPLPLNGVQPAPNEYVSPFAGAVVRFTKPVDLATVKWADTFFFAMRDLTNASSIEDFKTQINIVPELFNEAKYRTPFLITSHVYDEDGSSTSLRLQPTAGFYLDDTMRNPPPGADYSYFLHLISDSPDGGIRDLAGNPLDLQGTTANSSNSIVIPFTIDTRLNGTQPMFADNLAVSIVRRFASRDEDANPSYFLPAEVQTIGSGQKAAAYPLEDLFGAFVYVDNKLVARPTTRTRVIADNLNQSPFVAQPSPLAWCPVYVNTSSQEDQRGTSSATNVVNAGIQNPLNPYGCRMQTLWREIDLSLSRSDPFDFNIDVEQMYWAPYTGSQLSFDEFDRMSLWLGHSEFRPTPCVGNFSSMPSLPQSGLQTTFEKNFAWNPAPPPASGTTAETIAPRAAAYVDSPLTIDPAAVVYEPNGINRFLPLPAFQKPYFVYRDETVREQGLHSNIGSDLNAAGVIPYILSPFTNGAGRHWVDDTASGTVAFVNTFWNDSTNFLIPSSASQDSFTGGLTGSIALPLIADFWTYCDSSELPAGGGYIAQGVNGWQVAVTVQSSSKPDFRVLSAGRPAAAPQGGLCVAPGSAAWTTAQGGWAPGTTTTSSWVSTVASDNTFYWIMFDALKRQSVITNGFLDINNPHRVPEGYADPRLGPFYLQGGASTLPTNVVPTFAYEFDPPLSTLPSGTSLVPQFRGASVVDGSPWYWQAFISGGSPLFPTATYTQAMRDQLKPTAANFPLDPYKAGDAHIRKWDTRAIPGSATARNWWTYFYNRTVTTYVEDPNTLMNPAFTTQFAGPNETFNPRDVRYMNWRFVTSNNTDANPPVSPTIDTFALSYRFQPQ